MGSVPYPSHASASWDATYQGTPKLARFYGYFVFTHFSDFDGSKSIRVLNPCSSSADSDDFAAPECQWFDNPDTLSMQKQRWYSAAEAL